MTEYPLIQLETVEPRLKEIQFSKPINWSIYPNQHWAIIGANGSGKSLLVDILLQKYALSPNSKITYRDKTGTELSIRQAVKLVSFKNIYSLINTQEAFYQQRWNKGIETETTKVKDLIADENRVYFDQLVDSFSIQDLVEKEVSWLSSGELRKFLIISALLSKPQILILDNPYIGLDTASRATLDKLFEHLVSYQNLQIVVAVADKSEIPEIVTHILPIKDKQIYSPIPKGNFLKDQLFERELFSPKNRIKLETVLELYKNEDDKFEDAFVLNKVNIKYGDRSILRDTSWQVKRGDKWALLGENGSGKSTLLSLVCGDNPQAYANDITLFDKKRGSGESIWDIKKRIGYISPEMHLYYLKNIRSVEVVASGFFDTIGLYRKSTTEQEEIALQWMKIMGIEHLKETSFLKVSTGEQRLILLARVLVKNPSLLILDEPMHGLDEVNKQRVKTILEEFCQTKKTLIFVTHNREEIPNTITKEFILTKNQT